jgi:hypothetical protein
MGDRCGKESNGNDQSSRISTNFLLLNNLNMTGAVGLYLGPRHILRTEIWQID